MNQLLVWSLPSSMSLRFFCEAKDLASITCCDTISMVAESGDTSIELVAGLKGCDLTNLQKALDCIGINDQKEVSFLDLFSFSCDKIGNVLMTLHHKGSAWSYQVIPSETVKAWVLQLDLLHVLMEENEKEQQARGKGCCG